MRPELIVALDVPESRLIPDIVKSLPDEILYYKVGLELFISEGPSALEFLQSYNKKIFLDMKLHDIPRTVANAVKTAARHNIAMLTVHATGGRNMLAAAAEAAAEAGTSAPKLIAVTTLTSLDDHDFKDLGITRTIPEQAERLGDIAMTSGIDGLVTSAQEVKLLRERFGRDALLLTPGIRLSDASSSGNATADQKRIATPALAVKGGASHLVVGRPILEATDPFAAATEILRQMLDAWNS